MMGHRQIEQAALFYAFSLERHIPADHLDRQICRTWRAEAGAGSVLQQHRTALDRSRADDAHAHHRLLLRHTLGATAVRGGSSQSGLSMVLPARARWRSPRSLHLLQEPAWPVPRERSAAARL